MNLSFNFIHGIFQTLDSERVAPSALPTPAPAHPPQTATVSVGPEPLPTSNAVSELQRSARLFSCGPVSDMGLEVPVPWSTEGESPWVRPGLRFLQNMTGLRVEVKNLRANNGHQGFRFDEFRFGGTSETNGATVGVEGNTTTTIIIDVRPNRFLHPNLVEPVITNFVARYDNPLDISGRTPIVGGRLILHLNGFHFHPSVFNLPDPADYDYMHPPFLPLDQIVRHCDDLPTCVTGIDFYFGGAVAGIARSTSARLITRFWESKGFDFNEDPNHLGFYQLAHLPRDTIFMRSRPFIASVVRAILSQEGRDYLARNGNPWGPNTDPLFGGRFTGVNFQAQFTADDYVFPNCLHLTLSDSLSVLNSIRLNIENPARLFPAGHTPPEDLAAAVDFFRTLSQAYVNPNALNEIELHSNDDPTNGRPLQASLQIHTPALSFNWASETTAHTFSFEQFLARNIEISGPNLMSLIQISNPSTWANETPIRLTLDHPYFANLAIDSGDFRMVLPQVWADRLEIELPSLAELGCILNIRPGTALTARLFNEHLTEILHRAKLQISGLRIAGNFETDYRPNENHLEGQGAHIQSLILKSISPNIFSALEPRAAIPEAPLSFDSVNDTSEAQHLLSLVQHLEEPQATIPSLFISDAYLRSFSISFRALGVLRARENRVTNFRAYFPLHQLASSLSALRSSGDFSYTGEERQRMPAPAQNARLPGASSPVRQGRTNFQLSGATQVEDMRVGFDLSRAGRTSAFFDFLLSGQVSPGSIAYPSGNIRVQFGEGSNIDHVRINSQLVFRRGENSTQPFVFDVTYGGNMTLSLASSNGQETSAFSYGDPGQSPYLSLNRVLGRFNNGCIYANNNQLFISDSDTVATTVERAGNSENPSSVGEGCTLNRNNPRTFIPEPLFRDTNPTAVRNSPQALAQNPVSLEIAADRMRWDLLFRDGFYFKHNGSATLQAGLRYLLATNTPGNISVVSDLRNFRIGEIRGNVDAHLRRGNFQTTLSDSQNDTTNSMGMDQVYVVGNLLGNNGDRRFNLREYLIRGVNIFLSNGQSNNPQQYSLFRFQLPQYEFYRQGGLRTYPTLLGSQVEIRYPSLPSLYFGPRRSAPRH